MASAVGHGTQNDRNIIVQLSFDKGGRVTNMRDPRGNLTTYTYDKVNRRKTKVNPLNKQWTSAYEDLTNGGTRETVTYPGVNGGSSYNVQRDFDRLGRLTTINYGDAATTPNVTFAYNAVGDRSLMTEFDNVGQIRETTFNYDQAHRYSSIAFEYNSVLFATGSGTTTMSYGYDRGGLRTLLSINGERQVNYAYDNRGRMQNLNNWVNNYNATFVYDAADRINTVQRGNGFYTKYTFDIAGRLDTLRHYDMATNVTQSMFDYEVDGRGYRKQTYEYFDGAGGPNIERTMLYSYDHVGRLTTANYKTGAPGTATALDDYTYTYDLAGNRLSEVFDPLVGATTTRSFLYNAGNQLATEGVYTYTYDANGNLLNKKQGTTTLESYTWDRANRLTGRAGASGWPTTYKYDGLGNRVRKNYGQSGTVEHWLDLQVPLTQIVADWEQTDASRDPYKNYYLHSPLGFYGVEFEYFPTHTPGNNFQGGVWDGLGSERGHSYDSFLYDPYGNLREHTPFTYIPFQFTGEYTDANGLLYLRARHYNPTMGMMLSLDPFEGVTERPMSLNGYSYVEGNPVNWTDPSGMIAQPTQKRSPSNIAEPSGALGILSAISSVSGSVGLAKILSSGVCNVQLYKPAATIDPLNYCDRRRNDIIRALEEIARRVGELTRDFCELWELSQGYAIVPRRECKNAGTWQSHLNTLKQKKNRLDNLYGGFDSNNCPDPDNEVRDTVNEWSSLETDALLPEHEAKRRGISQPIPPEPNLAYIEACIGTEIFGICIPVLIPPFL